MSNLKRLVVFTLLLVAVASVASASSFRAADTVYLPAVARLEGGAGAFFRTDVVLSNLSTDRVVVSVAYVPTGATRDNSTVTDNLFNLPVLVPNERRQITDIAQAMGLTSANGYLIFFACREGGNCTDCDANAGDCKLISVQGRIYNSRADNATFGQLFPGIPWYSYVSLDSATQRLNTVSIPGVRQIGSAGVSGFRTNIGMLNASEYSSTVLRLRLHNPSGVLVGTFDQALTPLAHVQAPITSFFPNFTGEGYVTIEQVSATPIAGAPAAFPGFFAYGSVLDNISSDPTTLEAAFDVELPYDCVYGSKPVRRLVKR
jgi:hypothetical protein